MILKLSINKALWYEYTSADADFKTPTREDAKDFSE